MSKAVCPHLGEPGLPRPVCAYGAHHWHTPRSSTQHHSPLANASHQSVPTSEQLEGCGHWELRRGEPSRSILQAEKHLCRKEGEWHGDGGRQPAAGRWGAPCASARISLSTTGGWYKGPRFSRLREDRMIFTSTLAAFAHLWGTCTPRFSRSTWGSGTGLGGWLRSHGGPHSALA